MSEVNNTLSFELLEEGWSYYTLSNNMVLAVKADVTKIEEMKKSDGSPVTDESGKPLFKIYAQNLVRIIPYEEYQSVKKSEHQAQKDRE